MGSENDFDVVTGAFSYSGRAIARELINRGRAVRTVTGHPDRAPSGTPIEVRALDFADARSLEDSLRDAHTLYNTYWVRFSRGSTTHFSAVENSKVLFRAAQRAGVRRIVHVSITHPSLDSPFGYFRGKAEVERALTQVQIPYLIVRPAILFGGSGVLINNIAWLLRRFPVFAVGGSGTYRVRPVHVDDLARICTDSASGGLDRVVDAVGPERPTFVELVDWVRGAVGSRSKVVRVPGPALTALSSAMGVVLRDVLLTREEYSAMERGLADTEGPATGSVVLSDWLVSHRNELGQSYANEIKIHFE